MRRVVAHAFRTARRYPLRRPCFRTGNALHHSRYHDIGLRGLATSRTSVPRHTVVLQSSMIFRNLSLAFASSLVATGAWYAYTGGSESSAVSGSSTALSSPIHTVSNATITSASSSGVQVESDKFYTTASVDQPVSKRTDNSGERVVGMLTPEQATERLRRNEESYFIGRGSGVVRYDVVQLPSNDPIEDDHAEKVVEVPNSVAATDNGATTSDWNFWGVFDGHAGWTTSAKLRQTLISYVARELNATYKSAATNPSFPFPSPEAIDAAIKTGFLRLDHEIVIESVEKVVKANSKTVAAELLAPALSGSCALLAFYDSRSKLVRVACTGDSRAVLGRRSPSGKWSAIPLSEDQTGGTESEAKRLRAEHPGEDNVVRNGRILGGLEPSRAFGDAAYKWQRKTQEKIKRHFFGRTPNQLLKSPPYVTAEPIITTTKIDPSKGDFLVLATDGLWEMLSNEEVVGLVGQWIEHQKSGGKDGMGNWMKSWFSSNGYLPVEMDSKEKQSGQRLPIRQVQYEIPQDTNRFVVEDKNAATHLIRNALGGKNRELVCALLTLPSPYARRYRDDLTVEVIFFGEGENNGSVSVNQDASASVNKIPPKL
ncbi:pyruvate dehydrogenase (acetyl-transferring) phosphatase [Trichophyton mentagrophytes]|nr:pyruvate dehydrogenase (acetyl-transferring) phosphatase [Trichophyton mentagrophytes]